VICKDQKHCWHDPICRPSKITGINLMNARESWLKSADHNKYAKAIMKCRHAGGYCSADGFCHYGGECFKPRKNDIEDRLDDIESKLSKIIEALQVDSSEEHY